MLLCSGLITPQKILLVASPASILFLLAQNWQCTQVKIFISPDSRTHESSHTTQFWLMICKQSLWDGVFHENVQTQMIWELCTSFFLSSSWLEWRLEAEQPLCNHKDETLTLRLWNSSYKGYGSLMTTLNSCNSPCLPTSKLFLSWAK